MTDREVMQMALEALEVNVCTWDEKAKAMTALRARLAEPSRAERMRAAGFTRRPTLRELAYADPDPDPDPEPEMWGSPDGYWVENQYLYLRSDRECFTIPLYTAPPTRRPLTDESGAKTVRIPQCELRDIRMAVEITFRGSPDWQQHLLNILDARAALKEAK